MDEDKLTTGVSLAFTNSNLSSLHTQYETIYMLSHGRS